MGQACEELLKRRDPEGYYVIIAKPESLLLIEGFDAKAETTSSFIVVRVRSRRVARRLCELLLERNLLII